FSERKLEDNQRKRIQNIFSMHMKKKKKRSVSRQGEVVKNPPKQTKRVSRIKKTVWRESNGKGKNVNKGKVKQVSRKNYKKNKLSKTVLADMKRQVVGTNYREYKGIRHLASVTEKK
ncbi:UNVERIFIED_CONTAM: hypothetical protein K2H54_044227, partial [Gekko kuhli]